MNASKKLMWGLILAISGWVLIMVGILASTTLILACIGIPMALMGIPIFIWGVVWAWQGKFKRAEEVIASGVRQGIQQANEVKSDPTKQDLRSPPSPPNPTSSV